MRRKREIYTRLMTKPGVSRDVGPTRSEHHRLRGRILRELEERGERGYVSSASVAVLLIGLGDTAQAFRRLERAADEHDPLVIINFVLDPLLEEMRKQPRGQALL